MVDRLLRISKEVSEDIAVSTIKKRLDNNESIRVPSIGLVITKLSDGTIHVVNEDDLLEDKKLEN